MFAKTKMKQCWIISEGAAGMENQALGLTNALGIKPICIRIPKPPLHNLIPPHLQFRDQLIRILKEHAPKEISNVKDPSIVISCGHKSVAYSIALRRKARGETHTIHIQNPRVNLRFFDLIIAPKHDKIKGKNVITTNGAIHNITKPKLDIAKKQFSNAFNPLEKPIILALIGGSSKRFVFDVQAAKKIGKELRSITLKKRGSLIATTSRRTSKGVQEVLKNELRGVPGSIWTGEGKNPFLGYLAHADYILVTCDSITMTSEAVATGKPVYILNLEGRGSARFKEFHATFSEAGYIRWYKGDLSDWNYVIPTETELAAEKTKNFLGHKLLDLQQGL
ncbi:MAG: hypothetical protein CMM30_09175 [Rhodospirillaceae bacterium]|nr:hypothetical protein [Rhodospirillaceae bacterium]